MLKHRVFTAGLLALLLLCAPVFFFGARGAAQADVVEIDFGLQPSVYKRLISDTRNVPRKAFVSVNGGPYQQLQINTRGAFSRVIGQAMPSKKIPLRVKFRSENDFSPALSNTSVVFVNSKMPMELFTEYIALDLYASLGVPTPAHAFAFVRMNGVDVSPYLAVESVNTRFLEKQFGGAEGSLYKSTYDYVPSPYHESIWFGGLEAKSDRGHETLLRLLDALNRREGYEAYLDMDEILRYFACTAAVGGEGSLLTEQNNFFLYDNGGKIVLIPWDLGTAFDTSKRPSWIDCFYLDDYEDLKTPLFELIMQNPEYKETYHAYLRGICETFLAPARLHPYVTGLVETLAPYLARDAAMFLTAPTTPQDLLTASEMQYSPLLYTLDRYYQSLTAQLDGKSGEMYYDPAGETLDMTMTGEGIADFLADYSPMLDPSLPQKITDAYPSWRAGYLGDGIPDVYYEYCIAGAVFVFGCAALVFFFRFPARRGRTKR